MNANFIEFNKAEKLEELFQASHKEPVVFFKHSITCPISANLFEEMSKVESTVWVIVVQNARSISNEISKKTGIRHESPQTIVIKNGQPVYHAAHYDIASYDIESILLKERKN